MQGAEKQKKKTLLFDWLVYTMAQPAILPTKMFPELWFNAH